MPKSDTNLKLGDLARDTITGFEGIIIGRTDWLNGCVRFAIQPKKLGDKGLPVEPLSFDAEQLELVQKKAHPVSPTPGGGPMPEPSRGR